MLSRCLCQLQFLCNWKFWRYAAQSPVLQVWGSLNKVPENRWLIWLIDSNWLILSWKSEFYKMVGHWWNNSYGDVMLNWIHISVCCVCGIIRIGNVWLTDWILQWSPWQIVFFPHWIRVNTCKQLKRYSSRCVILDYFN